MSSDIDPSLMDTPLPYHVERDPELSRGARRRKWKLMTEPKKKLATSRRGPNRKMRRSKRNTISDI